MDLAFFNVLNILNTLLSKNVIIGTDRPTTSQVIAVVITGLVVVFLALIILIVFVWAFGKIFTKKPNVSQVSKSTETPKPAVSSPSPVFEKAGSDDEVIAVIAAAVAAMGASEGKSYKIKSVKAVKNKSSRSAWSMAGIQSDTTPF